VSIADWLGLPEPDWSASGLEPLLQDVHPPEVPVDLFEETFRIGVDSGLLFPLIAREAEYHIGWWARIYGQFQADAGLENIRTVIETSLGLGQSQSSRADQPYRITSNYGFLSVRGLADFLPFETSDLFVFGGLGGGIEIASGHVVHPSGRVDESTKTNFNLLMEAGAGWGMELSDGFYIQARCTLTYPVGSPNITLFIFGELGVQFLFQ
jgi:hypothetical protein